MPFHDAMTGARPARTSSGARQARAGSRLYCQDAGYYWQYLTFHMMPLHAAMTRARPARASSGARQARAGSSSRLYCKDAGYYWQYNAFHMLPFHAAMTGARPARTSSGARQARAGSRVLPRRRLLLTIPDISYDATSRCRRAPSARLVRRAPGAHSIVRGCIAKTPAITNNTMHFIYAAWQARAPRAHLVRRAPGARRFGAVLQRRRLLLTILHMMPSFNFTMPWQSRAQRAPRQARARRAQVLVRGSSAQERMEWMMYKYDHSNKYQNGKNNATTLQTKWFERTTQLDNPKNEIPNWINVVTT